MRESDGGILNPGKEYDPMKSIRIDGIDYPLNTDAEVQAAMQAHARHLSRLESERAQEKANAALLVQRADSAEARVKEQAAEIEKLNKALEKALRFDAEDSALLTKASAIMGPDFKPEGMTPEDIMRACCAKMYPNKDLSKTSPEYIQGLFDAMETPAQEKTEGADGTNMDGGDAPKDSPPADPAQDRADSLAAVNRVIGAGANTGTAARTPNANPRDSMIAAQQQRGRKPLGAK